MYIDRNSTEWIAACEQSEKLEVPSLADIDEAEAMRIKQSNAAVLLEKWHAIAEQMREDGFAVVFWTPEELEGVSISNDDFESGVVEAGNEIISFWKYDAMSKETK